MAEKLISISQCARTLTASGDAITPQSLGRYCNKHDLIRGKKGRALLVSLGEVRARRHDFTREKMRGEHLTPVNTKADTPAANAVSKPSNAPASLDEARQAKARKESAQADRAELELFKETGDVLATASVELMITQLLSLMKETLLGTGLDDDASRICTVAGLADDRHAVVKAELKARRRNLLTRLGERAKTEMAALDALHAKGFEERQAAAETHIQALRKALRDTQMEPRRA